MPFSSMNHNLPNLLAFKEGTCADPGIFVSGGPGQFDKKALTIFFLVLSLFYRSQTVNLKEIYHFSRVPEGVQHFPGGGGGPTFSRGGGEVQ